MKRFMAMAAVLALSCAVGAMPAKVWAAHSAARVVADDPFIGTFEGEDDGKKVRVVIVADDKDYKGTISAEGEVFEFYGVKMNETFFVGTARPAGAKDDDNTDEIEFEARIEGDTLTLDHEGDKVTLKRAGKGGAVVKKDPAKVAALGAAEPMVGEFEATFDGRTVRMKLNKDGAGYAGTATGPDGDPYDVTISRTGDDLTITLKKPDGTGKVETATGTVTEGGFIVSAEGKEITFARVGAPAPGHGPAVAVDAGGVPGEYSATVDRKAASLKLKTGDAPNSFVGTLDADERLYDVAITIMDGAVTGTITRRDGERTENFSGVYEGGVLKIKEGDEVVVFSKGGAPGGLTTLPTGITMKLPPGWTIKPDKAFSLITIPDSDLIVVLNDEKLGDRTHEQFTKEWTEFLEIFFLKPTEEARTFDSDGERRTKMNMGGERKDGTKIIGYNGVRSKDGLALGAVIAGEEAKVEKVLRDAESMMKSMRWPGDQQVEVEVKVERTDPPAPPKNAPAPAAAAPLQPDFVRVVLGAGLEFAHPEDWAIEHNKDSAVLTPAEDNEDQVYNVEIMAIEAGADPMGPAVQRLFTESVARIDDHSKMVGQPRAMQVAGQKAAVYTFDVGEDERMVVYTMVVGDRAYTLTGLGTREALTRSARTAEKVFQSFKARAPVSAGGTTQPTLPGAVDDALVGAWRTTKSEVVDGSTRNTETTLWLNADGTFKVVVSVHMPSPGGGTTDTRDPMTGEWSARGGTLWLKGSGGEKESMRYKPAGEGKIEITDGGETTVWESVKN